MLQIVSVFFQRDRGWPGIGAFIAELFESHKNRLESHVSLLQLTAHCYKALKMNSKGLEQDIYD